MATRQADDFTRAEMVLDGTHPWIDYDAVLIEYNLDPSFRWTVETFSEYVDHYFQEHRNDTQTN